MTGLKLCLDQVPAPSCRKMENFGMNEVLQSMRKAKFVARQMIEKEECSIARAATVAGCLHRAHGASAKKAAQFAATVAASAVWNTDSQECNTNAAAPAECDLDASTRYDILCLATSLWLCSMGV